MLHLTVHLRFYFKEHLNCTKIEEKDAFDVLVDGLLDGAIEGALKDAAKDAVNDL